MEFFTTKPDWSYPLLKGRYYDENDVKLRKKVVLIGKDLEKYVVNTNNEQNIKISGEDYKVVGVIGNKKGATPWDSRIFIPLTSVPETCKNQLIDPLSLNCIIYNSNVSTMDDYKEIKKNVLEIDDKATISVNELASKNDIIANSLGGNDKILFMSVLIFLISLINSINITSCWINDRKNEIGIKKAFGHTNFNISFMLVIEMLSVTLISCIISLTIQYILCLYFNSIGNITLTMSIENFLVSIFVVSISSLITSIIPIYKSLKIQPIEALKA